MEAPGTGTTVVCLLTEQRGWWSNVKEEAVLHSIWEGLDKHPEADRLPFESWARMRREEQEE